MKRLILPTIYNIPLFVICIFLFGGFDVLYHQYLFGENDAIGILMALGEIVLFSYLVCVCSYLLRKVHIKVLFYVILFVVYIVNFYIRNAFTTDISPKIIVLIFETNAKEASGFFKTYFLTTPMYKTLVVFGVLLIMTIVGELYRKKISQWLDKSIAHWILTIIILFGIIGGSSAFIRYMQLLRCKDAYQAERWLMNIPFRKRMPTTNLAYSLQAIRLSGQDMYVMINATKESLKDVTCEESDSLNIILVIGESYNKYHSGLYGYYLDTTPCQVKEANRGNLYAFNQVKAPHNGTSTVIKNVLCCNDIHEGERWSDLPYFPAIFKKAGYDVWFWDNQYKWDPDAAWAFTLNSILFNEEIQALSYTAINQTGSAYDAGLISNFEQEKGKDLGKRNLMIFHLCGQHFLAKDQYPHEEKYEIFSAKDVKDTASYINDNSRQRIAEYANATRYNDEVIHQIMEMEKDANTIMIYFPDHGEEVYDYRDFYGRELLGEVKESAGIIKYQIEIPFVVWCSDKWKMSHEEEWKRIGEAIDKPFSTDIICHLMFRLAGIKTKQYKATRDLFSPEYQPSTKEYDMLSL